VSKPSRIRRTVLAKASHLLGLLALICFPLMVAGQVLPPLPDRDTNRLSVVPRLFVREFHFEGNQATPRPELAKVTSSFTNREISTAEA
jgi:hypothetical protein